LDNAQTDIVSTQLRCASTRLRKQTATTTPTRPKAITIEMPGSSVVSLRLQAEIRNRSSIDSLAMQIIRFLFEPFERALSL
jgi:hypothetical protein